LYPVAMSCCPACIGFWAVSDGTGGGETDVAAPSDPGGATLLKRDGCKEGSKTDAERAVERSACQLLRVARGVEEALGGGGNGLNAWGGESAAAKKDGPFYESAAFGRYDATRVLQGDLLPACETLLRRSHFELFGASKGNPRPPTSVSGAVVDALGGMPGVPPGACARLRSGGEGSSIWSRMGWKWRVVVAEQELCKILQ
jgi:hypothetical protein